MQIKNILTGWGNLVKDKFNLLDESIKYMASVRMIYCNGCPIRKNNRCDPQSQIKNLVTGEIVNGCGCNIAAKTLDPESRCPAGKW